MPRKTKRAEMPKSLKELLTAPDRELSLTVPAGRIPPQAIEAEQSLLGSILLDGNAIVRVGDFLQPNDFYKKEHRAIYQAMLELFARHEAIDILSVGRILKDGGVLEEIGGHTYLASLVNRVPTPTHAFQYATIVKRKKVLRELIDASHAIAELGWSEQEDVEKVLDEAEQRIFRISQRSLSQDFLPVRSALEEAYERIEKLARNEIGAIRGIPTGFVDLDAKLSGLQRSDLIVLAARPALGKTSLALDIARHVAVREKKTVGIFSLEMSKEQVIDRLLAGESGIGLWKIRNGRLSNDDFDHLREALDRLSSAPIFIDDAPNPSALQMRTLARRLQAEHGLDLIIVDYLQLMESTSPSDSMVQQVTEISRSLKAMAKELNVPVLAISQLSRAVENRPDQVPKLSDLRESGSIEQDADVVLFIWREDRVKREAAARRNIAEIHIAKHRNGPTGKVALRFNEENASFWSLDEREIDLPTP
jgi:replicative DNA helicase